MGLGTLNDRATGQTIVEGFWNEINAVLSGAVIGRNLSGVPAAGQDLGTVAFPWGTVYATTVVLNGQAIDTSSIVSPGNRIVSGKVRAVAGSNLPQYIVPDGAAPQLVIDGTPTPLVYVVQSVTTTLSADLTKGSLTAAPSSNNTCLVNDTDAADQYDTKFWGASAHRKPITVDNMGSEITALIGKWAAFKISGTTEEYMLAFVESSTLLSKCMRGYFYDNTLAPVKAASFSNNDTITLMKLTWVFLEDDATTVDVTYTNPTWSFTSPGSPTAGDYWFDMNSNVWKRYDGATFQIVARTYIGMSIQDSSNCVAARSEDFYAKFDKANSLELEPATTEIVKAMNPNATINVAGTTLNYGNDLPTWNITTDLASAADMFDATEQASRGYYCYLKQNGDTVISDMFPYWQPKFYGWYHPYNTWRCVGVFYNDASNDILTAQAVDAPLAKRGHLFANGGNGSGAVATRIRRFGAVVQNTLGKAAYTDSANDGTQIFVLWPGKYFIYYCDTQGAQAQWGYSVNADSTEVTLDIGAGGIPFPIPNLGFLTVANAAGTAVPWTTTVELFLGDILRPHHENTISTDGQDQQSIRVMDVV